MVCDTVRFLRLGTLDSGWRGGGEVKVHVHMYSHTVCSAVWYNERKREIVGSDEEWGKNGGDSGKERGRQCGIVGIT